MAFFFDEFKHLKIRLEDVKSATDNFGDNNLIGKGGFGKVYKGTISHSKGRSMVAFKRLDSRLGQGNSEFWKEIMMLSRYTHENLVSLLGYCDEGGEKILVYEYASRGSLDRHLSDTGLTWMQRLKICLGVARGLTYLHNPMGTQQRVLHRDIKSSNILLDENWNAKVSDLGLSKISPANQQHTALLTNVVGTIGYLDPLYLEMGVLTKESDVYSFGVVLFEALCGKLCFEYNNGRCQSLVRMWKKSYKQKNLDKIIFQDLLQQMDVSCFESFSDIAYQCLQKTREERPLMAHVVGKLETALQFQEMHELEVPKEYFAMIMTAVPPLIYRSKKELQGLLSKGFLVNGGNTWISLNEDREHCVMISAAEFCIPIGSADNNRWFFKENSRFAEGSLIAPSVRFNAHARTRFLSPGITYTVNLVFKFLDAERNSIKPRLISLEYKLEGETKSLISYLAYRREDGWMMAELFQFTNIMGLADLEIRFKGPADSYSLVVEGIEFRPLEKVASEDDEKVDMHPISDLDTDWEGKLPDDYQNIIKRSKDSMGWKTEKELYFLFCKGFLIDNGEKWFYLAKNGKKCHMLSARLALYESSWKWKSLPESRFERVALECKDYSVYITYYDPRSQILSLATTYACFLVYNITEHHSKFEAPMEVRPVSKDFDPADFWFIYLVSPQTPLIRPNIDQNTCNPLHMPKIKGLPQLRNDGWMEVQVWEFQTSTTIETINKLLRLTHIKREKFDGLIVQGIEARPL